jgi:hypothetical protein
VQRLTAATPQGYAVFQCNTQERQGARWLGRKPTAGRCNVCVACPRISYEEEWLRYLQDFPDYMTQGETLEDLQERSKGLYH